MSVRDVIIIGAGPSGLSAAIAAKQRGLEYQVLEQGVLVNSIFHFPPQMVFFTTPELLEIGGLPFVSPYDKPTRAEALKYYRKVVDTFDLPIAFEETVLSVAREDPATAPEDGRVFGLRQLIEDRRAAILSIPQALADQTPLEDAFADWHEDEFLLAFLNRRVVLVVACPDAEALEQQAAPLWPVWADRALRYDERYRVDAQGRGLLFGSPRLDLVVIGPEGPLVAGVTGPVPTPAPARAPATTRPRPQSHRPAFGHSGRTRPQ